MNVAIDSLKTPLPSLFEYFPRPATSAKHVTRRRKAGLFASLGVAAAGAGVMFALGAKKRALVTGGAIALALGALRWQLARWFAESPAYELEEVIGELEIRRYPVRIEARTELEETELDAAMSRGFGRLACYIYGANTAGEDLAMGTPVVTWMRDGVYSTAFVMPPDRTIDSLPRPDDDRLMLREVGEKRIAALRFRGPWSRKNLLKHERLLLKRVVDAGLAARGSVALATYDSPTVLPQIRRNELWIELA